MAKSFDELLARSASKRVRVRANALTQKYLREMLLSELRKMRGKSQREVADLLNIRQPSLSKLEGQHDMQISTLRKIVEALDGELVLTAKLKGGEQVKLSQFAMHDVRDLQHA